MDFRDLTPDELNPDRGNPDRVAAVLETAQALDDSTPFLLLPLRLETRFRQREEPVDDPLGLDRLTATLEPAATALDDIAGTDLATILTGTVREKKHFKERIEQPLYDSVEDALGRAHEALERSETEARNPLEGTARDSAELEAMVERIATGLRRAGRAILRLRSAYQRVRLLSELDAIRAQAEPVLDLVRDRVLPTAALLRDLPARHAPDDERRLPRSRVADFATAYQAARAELASLAERLEPGPSAAGRILQETMSLARAAINGIRFASASCEQITMLPQAWRVSLVEDVLAVTERGGRIAALLKRASEGGGPTADEATELAGNLEDALARLEERVHAVTPATPLMEARRTRVVDELLVRIYPDDVAVDTHEEALTEAERDAAFAFWRETEAAGGDETLERGAWRALCLKHGSRRAAWIATRARPRRRADHSRERVAALLKALRTVDRRVDEISRNWPNKRIQPLLRAADGVHNALQDLQVVPVSAHRRVVELAGKIETKLKGLDRIPPLEEVAADYSRARRAIERLFRSLEALEVRRAVDSDLEFPELELKDGSWTTAPGSPVLPERFLIVTVSGERASHVVAGEAVPANLKLGLDPSPEDETAERFGLDSQGNLVVGESIRWMTDFEEARGKGMAVTIRISPEEAKTGFDRVYALGLRGGDPAEGRARVERLLDNHHYGMTGLSLIEIGTPTNNTERAPSGFHSDDDPDVTYSIERGDPLFDSAAPPPKKADGLRLAQALGIDPARLAHVAGAGGREIADAALIDRVLWPATLGNALEELLSGLFSLDTRDRLRAYALAHVRARGALPSVRIGDQPYGVLPVTAFTRFVHSALDEQTDRFNALLRDVLLQMHSDWTRLRKKHVKHAHSDDVVDAQQHLLDMVGLQATSVAAEYRFALNVARRHPLGATRPLQFGIPRSAEGAASTTADVGPVALLERFEAVFRAAFGLGPGPVLDPSTGLVSAAFEGVHELLSHVRAYGLRLVRSPKALSGEAVGDAAQWIPDLLESTPLALAEEARAGDPAQRRPLLYLLLRQALLLQHREAALRILALEGMLTEEARRRAGEADAFLVTSLVADTAITRWSYLFSPISWLDGHFGINFPSAPGTFYSYLRSTGDPAMDAYLAGRGTSALATGFPDAQRHQAVLSDLREHADDVNALGSLPIARLEQLLREHLDLCGHRLDAWLSGLAHQRLSELRQDAPTGVYVGAYGWLEDLRPSPVHPLATGVPETLRDDSAVPIHEDANNQGFVHAPSINHAATAAILRSGYLAQVAQPDIENRMAVNLSSRRVRDALKLIDGVRAGNDLGALLGYRFERFLHDAHAGWGVTLDDLISPLRRTFPSLGSVDPEFAAAGASERRVVDGLTLVETVYTSLDEERRNATLFELLYDGGNFTGYPFGLIDSDARPLLPPLTNAAGRRRTELMLRAIDAIADALDAVGDLVIGEAVHQIAQGNHARAAAAVAALAEGRAPPTPEIVDTPTRCTLVSQRLIAQLAPADGGESTELPAGWDQLPLTPRAGAEPSLNRWLGELLGMPDDIRARVVDEYGATIADVTAADLKLQPIDLLAIVGPGLDHGLAELSSRLLGTQRPDDIDDDDPPAPLQVELRREASWGTQIKSLLEVAPLLEAAGELAARGRPADASDFVLADTAKPDSAQLPNSDPVELQARVSYADARLRELGVELMRLLSDDTDTDPTHLDEDPELYLVAHADVHTIASAEGGRTFKNLDAFWATRHDFFSTLFAAAAFGIRQALPPTRYESRKVVARELLECAEATFGEVARRTQKAHAKLDEPNVAPASTIPIVDAARALFGEDFVILPRFKLRNTDEIATALAAEPVAARGPTLDGWLTGAAAVRPGPARLAHVLLLGDAFNAVKPEARAFQLPHVDGEPWLGGALPDAARRPAGDRLSIVVLGADQLDTAGGVNVGIVVDQWQEAIPDPGQTTGVTFHYDQPDASPPQCLLLAVPPEWRGGWAVEDLLQTLHDTLELAKNRAVELDHLHEDLYAQLLPAVLGELVPEAITGTVADVRGSRVILDFGVNNPRPGVPA